MPSGGYRKPKGAQPASGPGKFSKRTDAQKVQTPKLSGSDLQSGDVGKLQAAQKIAPLPQGVASPTGRPPLDTSRLPQGSPGVAGSLPSFLTDGATALPGQPDTTGLSTGPGGGADALQAQVPPDNVRDLTIMYLANVLGNQEVSKLRDQMVAERSAPVAPLAGGTAV